MIRYVVLGVTAALLLLLTLQNMSPALALVVLGGRSIPLPIGVWLVGAIATGSITTLLIYGLATLSPSLRRPYRPMGQRLPSPERPPSPSRSSSSNSTDTVPKSAYDTDWESFKAPQQWDDWGQRPDPQAVAAAKTEAERSQPNSRFSFKREPYAADASVNEIESGWEEDNRRPMRGASPVDDSLEDIAAGWEDDDRDEGARPRTRIYKDGSLFNDDLDSQEDVPPEVGPDDVYDADYRVIIPPYRPLDDA